MCTRFTNLGEFCEQCASVAEAEAYVAARAAELNKGKQETPAARPQEPEFVPPSEKQDRDKSFIWLAVGGAWAMLFFSMLLYAYPTLFEFDSTEMAAREAAQKLEDCRLVFEEIGYLLQEGEMPDTEMRCAESDMPNIISRDGEFVTIHHPNPRVYGLSELYVSSDSHEVIFVELEESS